MRTEIKGRDQSIGMRPFLLSTFGVFGVLFGVWQVLLADLDHSLHLSSGSLGLAISGGLTASLPGMLVGGQVIDRWGLRTTLLVAGAMMGGAFCLLAIANNYIVLIVLLVTFFAASGIYDVSINAAAISFEQKSGRRVISYMHAAFSAGAFVGALTAGALDASGVPFRSVYVGVAFVVWGSLLFVWHEPFLFRQQSPQKRENWKNVLFSLNVVILCVAFISTLASLSEGTISNWSAIYLRSSLGFSSLLGAFGVAFFNGAMMIGRVSGASIVIRFGRKKILLCAGIVTAMGMAVALATNIPSLILVGFLVVGLAISVIGPIAFSLGGDLSPEKAGEISSIIAIFGYCGLLLGPSLVGGLAELAGLRGALASVIVAGIIICGLGLRVPGTSR